MNKHTISLPELDDPTELLGRGMTRLGSSRDVPGLAPKAMKESGNC